LSDSLVFKSIRQLGGLVQAREVSPTELAEVFLDRLERLGPDYNAVVTVTRERALREARRAEEEIKVAKGIEVTYVSTRSGQFFVVRGKQDFGAAQGVQNALPQEATQYPAEKSVAQKVQKSHGLLFHGIYEAGSHCEVGAAGYEGVEEFGQFLWGDGQVAVQDYQYIASGCVKSLSYGVPFARSVLPDQADVCSAICRHASLDCFGSAVC